MPNNWFTRIIASFCGINPSRIDVMAKMFGGYIGETVRIKWGGEWHINTEITPGNGIYALSVSGKEIFPCVKVWKRLINGSEDDIWFYYQALFKNTNNS